MITAMRSRVGNEDEFLKSRISAVLEDAGLAVKMTLSKSAGTDLPREAIVLCMAVHRKPSLLRKISKHPVYGGNAKLFNLVKDCAESRASSLLEFLGRRHSLKVLTHLATDETRDPSLGLNILEEFRPKNGAVLDIESAITLANLWMILGPTTWVNPWIPLRGAGSGYRFYTHMTENIINLCLDIFREDARTVIPHPLSQKMRLTIAWLLEAGYDHGKLGHDESPLDYISYKLDDDWADLLCYDARAILLGLSSSSGYSVRSIASEIFDAKIPACSTLGNTLGALPGINGSYSYLLLSLILENENEPVSTISGPMQRIVALSDTELALLSRTYEESEGQFTVSEVLDALG